MLYENYGKFQFQCRQSKLILKIHCIVTQPYSFILHVTVGSVAIGRVEVCDGAHMPYRNIYSLALYKNNPGQSLG